MYEIRFHGRGGQGAVMAGKILAKALVDEGKYCFSVPAFGFERRGAPVASFLRFDDTVIRQHTNIYHPNCVICVDPTLMQSVNIFDGMQEDGVLVQATKKKLERLTIDPKVKKVGLCDAFGIALDVIGRPITNTIMLGAFVKTTGLAKLDSIKKAMGSVAFKDAALEKNMIAVQRGFDETTVYDL